MPDPNQNQIQTPEQIAAANPPAAPQPIPQYNPEDAVTGVVGDYLKGIRARVIAPVEQSIKKIASNPKVAPFVAAADAAVGGPAVRAAAQTPQGKSVTQAVSNFSKNPILNLAEQAKGSMMGSELGPEGGILEDAAGNLLKNIRWRTAPEVKGDPFSHVPEAKPTEPVYRARPIGQEGVPSESHAQATASEPEARQYAQNLEEMTGKPHEVVRVDLNKVPADKYTRQPGPNGNDWVKFHEPVSEEHVEPFHEAGKVPDFIANAKEGVLKQDAPEAANVKKYVEDNGGVFRGMQVNQVGDKKIGQIYFDVPPDRVGGKTNVTAGVSLDKATPEGIKSSIDAMAAQHAPAVKATETSLPEAMNEFNKSEGRPEINPEHVQVDPRASDIADAWRDAEHAPENPEVKKSYSALKRDVDKQFELAKKLGISIDTSDTNPYNSAEDLHNDILNNKHLTVWKGAAPDIDHPMSEVDSKTGMTANEKFRAVHDIFGHATHKADFSPNGEESAWNFHRQMFSDDAIPALTSETRGQSSYVNKYGEFGPQKATILPEKFNSRPAEEGYHPDLQKVIDKHGTIHSDPAKVADKPHFITPDGKFVALNKTHDASIESATGRGGDDSRVGFINDTGAIRTRMITGKEGKTLHISVPKEGVTPEQVDALKQAVAKGVGRNGNIVLETADNPSNIKTSSKEFASPADIDTMLKKVGAHPEGAWNDVAAKMINEQSAGAIDPKTGKSDTSGFGVEVYPEAKQRLDHQPTPEDIKAFHDKNKEIFDQHPELRVGWDNDPEKGWELNIGASTQNREGAEWLGRKLDQRAIWDIANQKEIPTGGSNTNLPGSRYTLDKRLEDLSGKGFEELQKDYPTQAEIRSMIRAGGHAAPWWADSRDAMHLMASGDPETAHDLGQFLTAVSSNKGNDVALRMGMHIYNEWLDAGSPTEPGAITDIAHKAMQTFGDSEEGRQKGIMPVDTMMLERYVTGRGSFYHPTNVDAAKIAQMGLTMGGDPWAGVLDRHTGRTMAYGEELQPKAKSYFAMKAWLREAAESEKMTLEEAQAANWVVGRLLSPDTSLTAPEILDKIKSGDTMKEGETYANILIENPKANELARKIITKFGGDPDAVLADIKKITEREKPGIEVSKREASNPTLRTYIGKAVKGRDAAKAAATEALATPKSSQKIPKKFKQDATVKDNMNDPDTRFTAARHEAGHAVISEMLNPGSVDSMALTNRGGETNINPPKGKQTVNQLSDDDIRNMVATSLAGGLSEPGGTTPKHSSSDMIIRNQVTGMRASTPGQNISRLVTGKVMGNDPMLAAPNVQAEAQARVNAILADPKMNRAIDGLAGKFNETGKMTGKQVREYLKNVK